MAEEREIKVSARVLDEAPAGVRPKRAAPAEIPQVATREISEPLDTPEPPPPQPGEVPLRWPSYLTLAMLAWLNLFINIAGLVCSFFWILPGTIAAGAEQTTYLKGDTTGWGISWGLWMLCGIVTVSFMAVLSRTQPVRTGIAYLASLLAGVGLAVDLLCDAINITVLPTLLGGGGEAAREGGRAARAGGGGAAGGAGATALFHAVERLSWSGGMVVANGLYALAVLLMTHQLRKGGVVSGAVSVIGLLTVLGSGVLVYAGFAHNGDVAKYATVPVILLYCSWVLSVARAIALKQPNVAAMANE